MNIKSNALVNQKMYSNNLLPFDEQTIKSILLKKNNVIINNRNELAAYVKEALQDNTKNKNLHLGLIPKATIDRIKVEITDIKQETKNNLFNDDINYALAINQNEIRHLKKDSLTIFDVINFVNKLDELIVNFDSVRYTIYDKNQQALRFKKTMSDGTHLGLEIISNKNHTIRTQTLFLEKSDFKIKKETYSQSLMNNSLSKTSEMNGLSVPFHDNNDTTNLFDSQ